MTPIRTRKYPCSTCAAEQPHRQLDRAEQEQLKERLGRASVNEFWVCVNVLDPDSGRQCRNLRTGWTMKPFATPVRLSGPR